MIDPAALSAAYAKARRRLLEERASAGHWIGELSTSALATATAVSALAARERWAAPRGPADGADSRPAASVDRGLIDRGVQWLAHHQNQDGGWGDTDKSRSNIAAAWLAVAAFHLAGRAAEQGEALGKAERYLDRQGRAAGLRRRYGADKTFAVPILTNVALAGLAAWRDVAPLPFELACVPQRLYRFLGLPVVSYAIPALVAIGQARRHHERPRNPLVRLLRWAATPGSLRVLTRMQPASGGFLEATPLTSFVVMSLAGSGREDHPVARRGLAFLRDSVRPDGGWPIDTNLATWNTTSALNALAAGGEDLGQWDCLDWLLSCQHAVVHPYTGARPGGWGWSDLSGAVPDADDTAGALLALAAWIRSSRLDRERRRRIAEAAAAGVRWLLNLQNSDGGWPTFCRGWGKLPFDRSGDDLTAHAMRAIHAWRGEPGVHRARVDAALARGLRRLAHTQRSDGSWIPLWFGSQEQPSEENPVYGVSKVLMAYRDLGRLDTREASRGRRWLEAAQLADGGWGGGADAAHPSVEETALAVEALSGAASEESSQLVVNKGVQWLIRAVESDRRLECSPIGFYFAKLWYYERLYPLIFTVSALGRAMRRSPPPPA